MVYSYTLAHEVALTCVSHFYEYERDLVTGKLQVSMKNIKFQIKNSIMDIDTV